MGKLSARFIQGGGGSFLWGSFFNIRNFYIWVSLMQVSYTRRSFLYGDVFVGELFIQGSFIWGAFYRGGASGPGA